MAGVQPLGRYLLYSAIARGGMASVHLARLSGAVGFSRVVAIKRLHPHLATDPEFVNMFVDEARLAARIRHPNVIPTLDVVAEAGEVFIVMDYVPGESLARLFREAKVRRERIPVPFALAIVAGALHGLHAAHEATDENGAPLGLVHRDVSPQNVLVGSDGVARVLDFGVAKAKGRIQETGDSGSLKGKIAYMAPEQLASQPVTRATDIYAACVMLWEILAGERLFDAENDAARAAKILGSFEGKLTPPSRHNPDVTPEIDALVMRGLSFNAADRFATAKELAVLLERNGGLQPASDVAEWVTRIAGEKMRERAAQLASIESESGRLPKLVPLAEAEATQVAAPPDMETQTSASLEERPPARRTSLLLGLVAAVVALAVAVGVGLAFRRPAPVPEAAPASIPTPLPSVSVAAPPTSEPVASAAPSATASAAPSASAIKQPAKPVVKPAGGRATAAPKDDCDPPYTFDAENHKVYKRHCLAN